MVWLVVIAYAVAYVVAAWAFYNMGWKRGFDDAQAAHVLGQKFIAAGAPRRPDGF